jgi:hypothetical protein
MTCHIPTHVAMHRMEAGIGVWDACSRCAVLVRHRASCWLLPSPVSP